MYYILVMLVLAFIGGLYLQHKYYEWEMTGQIMVAISGCILFFTVLIGSINYYGTKSEVKQFESIQATIQDQRNKNISEFERVELTNTIVNSNRWLAGVKYWNETIFDIFIPDEVMELEPIE